MIKKVVIIAGVAMLLSVLLFRSNAVSYVRTSAGYVTESVRDSVPIEFEIERARGMIKDLLPEVRKNTLVIAKEAVEVKRLEEQIESAEADLAKQEGHMTQLHTALGSGRSEYRFAGRSFTSEQVKVDLTNRLRRCEVNKATLASLRQILDARQRSLDAANHKLTGMLAKRRQLAVEVENLEARMQMIAAAKATSDYQFDDSRLGRVKELITHLRTRLDVADTLVKAESRYVDEIPLDETAPDDIVDQVTEYFDEDNAPATEAIAQQ